MKFVILVLSLLAFSCQNSGSRPDLIYVAAGVDVLPVDLIRAFEASEHAHVFVSNFETDEELLNQVHTGMIKYDLAITTKTVADLLVMEKLATRDDRARIKNATHPDHEDWIIPTRTYNPAGGKKFIKYARSFPTKSPSTIK